MEVTGSPKFLEAMLRLKRACLDFTIRDAVIDEVEALQAELERVKERLQFFQPKCAQCDAPLDVHPYQCKLWGLCDKCVGDVDAGDPREPVPDLTVLDVAPGGKVDLGHVKTRYVSVRIAAEPTTSGSIGVHPADFMKPTCPGCGHVGCAVNSEGCGAGQCSCEALKRPDPATWIAGLKDGTITFGADYVTEPSKTVVTFDMSNVRVETKPIPPDLCPHCEQPKHDPDPEKNAKICPEIPF